MGRRNLFIGFVAGLLAVALPLGIFLSLPEDVRAPSPREIAARDDGMRPGEAPERKAKLTVLNNDVATTEALCRLQCKTDLRSLAADLKRDPNGRDMRASLSAMRRMHPHMHALGWVEPAARGGRAKVRAVDGAIDDGLPHAQTYWNDAARAVGQGRSYESKPIRSADGDLYFVLGEPAGNGGGGAVGLVHQDVLKRVAQHQKRNLRLQEFPDEDRRFGIRAVDPRTGQEKDVDSAEENEGISHYKKGEVVVRFTHPPGEKEMERIKTAARAVEVKKLGYAYVFRSDERSTDELLNYFKTLPVEYAEPHYLYVTNAEALPVDFVPNDELYSRYQWNLPIIGTSEGWTVSRGAPAVTVAVVDTGVALQHPDLQGHLVEGFNVVDPAMPPEDDVGHGTHVAGVVSALTDNGQGVAGMTWYNNIMPVKVLDSTGMGSTYSVAQGIIWATDHGAKVINMSLGNYASAEFLHDAIRYAFDRDVVLIAATGNDSTSQPGFPAAYPEVFAVSATNPHRQRASFSNYGDYVDVVAPGENIASTYLDNQYAALSGTSMASPHVAALAALIRSANPKLKNTEIYDIMRRSAVDLGPKGKDPDYGYGQIHVAKALQLATGRKPPEPEAVSDSRDERLPVERRETWLDLLLHAVFRT